MKIVANAPNGDSPTSSPAKSIHTLLRRKSAIEDAIEHYYHHHT
jgi:hypothetical protein